MESFEPSVLLAPVSLSLSVPSLIPLEVGQWERDQSMKGQEEEEKKTNLARRCFTSSSWSDSFVNKGPLLYDFSN